MDPLFSLLIALVIAFPVLAIVALVLAIGARERVRKLALRLARLEGELFGRAVHPAPPPPLAPEAVKELKAKIEEPAAPATPEGSPIIVPAPSARPPKPHISLENASARNGWSGPAALRSHSAAFSSCATQSSRVGSVRARGSCSQASSRSLLSSPA